MAVEDPFKHPSLGSGVFYKDPRAALDWLEAALGFARSMVVSDAEGNSSMQRCDSATATSS